MEEALGIIFRPILDWIDDLVDARKYKRLRKKKLRIADQSPKTYIKQKGA